MSIDPKTSTNSGSARPSGVPPEQRRRNTQLGLILASVALAFMVGFVVKMTWL